MRSAPLIVLKFGGSVLLDESRLRIAVHEVYRWRRDGWRVVAVVSAFAGRTDALLETCTRVNPRATASARAGVVAQGELESAALLGLLLDAAGVPASVLTPGAVSFIADGPSEDAAPRSIDRSVILEALDRDGVVVFPGFVALDESRRTVTLGRGGSDLTALFLADALGADKCRLIKDVDGLYERDPASAGGGPTPRRYGLASYEDALATDGSIVQHKALHFAQRHGIEFELGRFNGSRPTSIGSRASEFHEAIDTPRRLSLALLGLGTVGGGVLRLVSQLPGLFDVRAVAVRDGGRPRASIDASIVLSHDAVAASAWGADVVVEAIGGVEVAYQAAIAALSNGSSFVTANKALVAERGDELVTLARRRGLDVRCSAAVGGSTPVLERVNAAARPITRVRGVLNGTSNFVLERIREGASLWDAVAEAQRLGLAEDDPSRDLDGRDAIDKLRVIAEAIGVRAGEVRVEHASPIDARSIGARAAEGRRLRHVASLDRRGAIRVELELVGEGDALFDVPGEWNAVVLEFDDGSFEVVRGRGAGRWATAEAVVADLLELSRRVSAVGQAATAAAAEAEVSCV